MEHQQYVKVQVKAVTARVAIPGQPEGGYNITGTDDNDKPFTDRWISQEVFQRDYIPVVNPVNDAQVVASVMNQAKIASSYLIGYPDLDPHLQRVAVEYIHHTQQTIALNQFIETSPVYASLGPIQQGALTTQLLAMVEYRMTLRDRLPPAVSLDIDKKLS